MFSSAPASVLTLGAQLVDFGLEAICTIDQSPSYLEDRQSYLTMYNQIFLSANTYPITLQKIESRLRLIKGKTHLIARPSISYSCPTALTLCDTPKQHQLTIAQKADTTAMAKLLLLNPKYNGDLQMLSEEDFLQKHTTTFEQLTDQAYLQLYFDNYRRLADTGFQKADPRYLHNETLASHAIALVTPYVTLQHQKA